MSKEISKAFRLEIEEFLSDSPHSLNRLSDECTPEYTGLYGFMASQERAISVDNEAVVCGAMATLRGKK